MGKFDDIAGDIDSASNLTLVHIEAYVKSLVQTSDDTVIDPAVIEKALEGFSMPANVARAAARITHFCFDFL